jgi:hypothetical protein
MISPRALRNGIFVVMHHPTVPSGSVSFSTLPIIGSPVRITCFSSASAGSACSGVKKSKSVFPIASSGLVSPKSFAIARLMHRKRLSVSLK